MLYFMLNEEKVALFFNSLSKPYFYKTTKLSRKPYTKVYEYELDQSKAGSVLATLIALSFIKSFLKIDFDFFLASIPSFLGDFIVQICVLNLFFAIGATIDNFIKTKYLQFGWMFVLYFLIY